MYVVLAVIVFLIFITYGISEYKLVVSLHNIRVFISRICDGIARLLKKKKSYKSDWDGELPIQKQRAEYRSFKENKENSREYNLLVQVRKLEEEKTAQEQQYHELSNQYNEKISLLSKQIRSYERSINVLKKENEEYKERLNGLLPIDKSSIANPFCVEYEQIMSITNKLIGRLINEFESLPDRQKKQCYPFFIDLVYARQDEENNSVVMWYSLLKNVALIPKELSFDLISKGEDEKALEEIRLFLQNQKTVYAFWLILQQELKLFQ